MPATNIEPPASSTNPPAEAGARAASTEGTTTTTADTSTGERASTSSRHLPLFREPLSNHSAEDKVAAMRAALAAGADVHQLDGEPVAGHNEGRPLDACLNVGHMAGGARLADNVPAVELLLRHGADPRLGARPGRLSPLRVATYYAENAGSGEARATWGRILALFEEAVSRLEEAERA